MGGEGRHHLGQGIWAELFLVHPDVYRVGPLCFSSCCPRLGVRGSPRLHRKANREEALEIKATDVTITQCVVLLAFPTLAWR